LLNFPFSFFSSFSIFSLSIYRLQMLSYNKLANLTLLSCLALTFGSSFGVEANKKDHAVRDTIVQLNSILVGLNVGRQFPALTRNCAIANLAAYDAINSIDPQFTPYVGFVNGIDNIDSADESAAIISAFCTGLRYDVNTRLNSASTVSPTTFAYSGDEKVAALAYVDNSCNALFDQVKNGRAKKIGIQVGIAAAQQVIDSRQNDGTAFVVDPWLGVGNSTNPTPGSWYASSPFGTLGAPYPSFSVRSALKPWIGEDWELVPNPTPLNIHGEKFLEEMTITKYLGRIDSPVRTVEQTNIALFWNTCPSGPSMSRLTQQVVLQKTDITGHEAVRVFAAFAAVEAHVITLNLIMKRELGVWRPWQAIQNGGVPNLDNNHFTDPTWTGLLIPVPNPEFPAGHPMGVAGITRVVANLLGNDFDKVTVCSDITQPRDSTAGAHQNFTSFTEAENSVIWGRVYGGLHTLFSGQTGRAISYQVADYATTHYFQPL
jgi:hypothetical protein